MKRLPRTLSAVEIRVLGALLEKEQATPAYYPMTINGLVQAANQKSNRNPVMSLNATEVQVALDSLFEEDVFAWRSRAGRTVKWKHNVERRWQLSSATKAVMTLLMLRGAQTVGELRVRSERLHAFENLSGVEAALVSLAEGEDPLVRELARQPGQKENRWTHLLGGEEGMPEAPVMPADPGPRQARAHSPLADRLDRLEGRVKELEETLEEFRLRLGGGL